MGQWSICIGCANLLKSYVRGKEHQMVRQYACKGGHYERLTRNELKVLRKICRG